MRGAGQRTGVNLPGRSEGPEPGSKEVRDGPQPEAGESVVGSEVRSWLSEAGLSHR